MTTTMDFFDQAPPRATSGDTFAPDFFNEPPDPHLEGVERPERDEDSIQRARNGRPYIHAVDDEGNLVYVGKRNPEPKYVTYTRTTTWAKTLDEGEALVQWRERMTALGVAMREDVQLSILSHPEIKLDKRALMEDVETAKEHAGASQRSRRGTALHALTERMDRGLELGFYPPKYEADLAAYRHATRYFEWVEIERFVVLDEWKIGGTPDRLLRYLPCSRCGAELYIGDLKTGDVYWSAAAIAVQLAIYAHGKIYDVRSGERRPWPGEVCHCKAVVIHLPQGEGTCTLEWTNIREAWDVSMPLIRSVREHRNRKDWSVAFEPQPTPAWLHRQIAEAPSREAALALHAEYKAQGIWLPEHTEHAKGLWS